MTAAISSIPSSAIIVFCTLYGLVVGSFLNVVIWRVPRGLSVNSPPSACPACGMFIRPKDNIPVASWLILRGRCRDCAAPISGRYPLVEATTACLFGLVFFRFGLTWEAPAFLYASSIALALSLIDLDTLRLPNPIVLSAYPATAFLLIIAAWGTQDWTRLTHAAFGAVALGSFYGLLWFIRPDAMGFGDVKLAPVVGAYLTWIGWQTLFVGTFGAFLIGAVASMILLISKRADRKSAIPFGPCMLLASGIAIAIS